MNEFLIDIEVNEIGKDNPDFPVGREEIIKMINEIKYYRGLFKKNSFLISGALAGGALQYYATHPEKRELISTKFKRRRIRND